MPQHPPYRRSHLLLRRCILNGSTTTRTAATTAQDLGTPAPLSPTNTKSLVVARRAEAYSSSSPSTQALMGSLRFRPPPGTMSLRCFASRPAAPVPSARSSTSTRPCGPTMKGLFEDGPRRMVDAPSTGPHRGALLSYRGAFTGRQQPQQQQQHHFWNLSLLASRSFTSSSPRTTTMTPVTIFTEEEQMVQETTRTWARSFLLPKVRDMDDAGALDPQVAKALFEQGFMGLEIPEDMGGSGLNFTTSILVIEELSRVDPSVSIMVDIHNTLIVNALRRWGSQELQQMWLPRLASDTVSSFCLSEAGSGSDAFSMRTTATLRNGGDSHDAASQSYYVINGEKMWISSAKQAGVFLVFANVDVSRGYKGITAFVVDAHTEGITVGKPENKLGLKASSTCPVLFDNVVVPASAVLGEVGKGYKYCIEILNEGRIGIAAQQLGIAKGCLDVVFPHLNDRVQFGKTLMDFQAVQHQYAQAAVDAYAAECMIYNACRLKEMGHPIVKEASMCKYYSSGVAERVASKSIELLGGIGFTQDLLVEKMYRDCKVGSIYEGTSNIQLQTIAKLLQNEYNRDR